MAETNAAASRGTTHCAPSLMDWATVKVYGQPLEGSIIHAGEQGVMSFFFRMKAGEGFKRHQHSSWVQVTILEGALEVVQDDGHTFTARAGEAYFTDPGHPHIETAREDSLVLVTTGEKVRLSPPAATETAS